MRTAWVHSGAFRAPLVLSIQGDVRAHFAGGRELGVTFPMRAASVDPKTHTTNAARFGFFGVCVAGYAKSEESTPSDTS